MFKGWIGEQKTEFNLRFSLDKKLYRRFHDVIIPSSNGTTQVDHILVSPPFSIMKMMDKKINDLLSFSIFFLVNELVGLKFD